MGWEKGGRYYTKSRRENGRVIRQYIGCGVVARVEADRDHRRRQREAADRLWWHQERDRMRELEEPLKELETLCAFVLRATLEAAGYHQHDRGEWRKRRG
jgi:hypothetical protein